MEKNKIPEQLKITITTDGRQPKTEILTKSKPVTLVVRPDAKATICAKACLAFAVSFLERLPKNKVDSILDEFNLFYDDSVEIELPNGQKAYCSANCFD